MVQGNQCEHIAREEGEMVGQDIYENKNPKMVMCSSVTKEKAKKKWRVQEFSWRMIAPRVSSFPFG